MPSVPLHLLYSRPTSGAILPTHGHPKAPCRVEGKAGTHAALAARIQLGC